MRWHRALAEASLQFAPVSGAQLIQLRQSVRRQPVALGAGRAVLSGGKLLPVFNFIQTPSGEKRMFLPNLSRYRKLAGLRFNSCFSDPCRKRRLLNSRGAGPGEGECYAYSTIA
jgi:hypothetical protein